MAALGVQLDGSFDHAGLLEGGMSLPDALAEIAHRIRFARSKQDGQTLFHVSKVLRLLDVVDAHHHIPEQSGRGHEAAAIIGNIAVNDGFVPGQPILGGAGTLDTAIVAAEDHLIQLFIGLLLVAAFAYSVHDLHQGRQGKGRLPGGAADDGGSNTAVRVLGQNGAGHERAHGVAEEDIGNAGVLCHGQLHQLAGIVHRRKPAAVEIADHAFLTDRAAVTHMILRHHEKALGCHKLGIGIVALHKFADAMNDLQDRFRCAFRRPAAIVDLACAAGIKIMIGTHQTTS